MEPQTVASGIATVNVEITIIEGFTKNTCARWFSFGERTRRYKGDNEYIVG